MFRADTFINCANFEYHLTNKHRTDEQCKLFQRWRVKKRKPDDKSDARNIATLATSDTSRKRHIREVGSFVIK